MIYRYKIKICLIVVLTLLIGNSGNIFAESIIRDISLNGTWEFAYSASLDLRNPPEESLFSPVIKVPGYWHQQLEEMQAATWWPNVLFNPDYVPIKIVTSCKVKYPDVSYPYLLGAGWYRKTIDVNSEWKGRAISLKVGRHIRKCYVYVNGGLVGSHVGHSAPFELDLSRHLKYGEPNKLMIVILNLDRSVQSCYLRGCSNFSTGIRNEISLHITGRSGRIESQFLRSVDDFKSIRWWVDLKKQEDGKNNPSQLKWNVRSTDGKIIQEGSVPVRALSAGELYRKKWDIPMKGIKPWSIWDTNPYTCEVIWEENGKILDESSQSSGFRSMIRSNKKLMLNGRSLLLRGWSDHNFHAPYTHPPESVEYYRKLISRMKEIGYNFVRFHTSVPPEELVKAADELGILLQVELYNNGSGKRQARDVEAWKDILYWHRKHHSVVIYGEGNERYWDEARISFYENIYDIAKELDPGCLFMPSHCVWGIDFRPFTPPSHIKDPAGYTKGFLDRATKSSDVFSPMSLGLKGNALDESWESFEEECRIFDCHILPHETEIIGWYHDLSLEGRYAGTELKSLFSDVRKNLKAAGRLHMAKRYYENSARMQSLQQKFLFEKARLCESVYGYDHLGGMDSHWHRIGYCCGTLNEFLELKHGDTDQEILQFNGESVVLLDIFRKRSFWSRDTFDKSIINNN